MLNQEIEQLQSTRLILSDKLDDLLDAHEERENDRLAVKIERYNKRVLEITKCIEQSKKKAIRWNTD